MRWDNRILGKKQLSYFLINIKHSLHIFLKELSSILRNIVESKRSITRHTFIVKLNSHVAPYPILVILVAKVIARSRSIRIGIVKIEFCSFRGGDWKCRAHYVLVSYETRSKIKQFSSISHLLNAKIT